MTRLSTEIERLWGTPQAPRAAVIELAAPADWPAVAALCKGLQADLQLPLPAIAVNGRDGLQLWLALADDVPARQARSLLDALLARYAPEPRSRRITLWPADGQPAPAWPPLEVQPGQWSAFVAPDLAPLFADDPWLDMLPNPDGQADVLQGIRCISAADLGDALRQLLPAAAATAQASAPVAPPAAASPRTTLPGGPWQDPRAFLLAVMNDDSVPMAQRIEAAKGLIQGV